MRYEQAQSIESVQNGLEGQGYFPSEGLASAIFLAISLQRPIFLEGEPGVGKTEVAKVLSSWLDTDLIRLQCYEGLDASHAIYDVSYTHLTLPPNREV